MLSDLGFCGTVQHIVVDVFQYRKVCAIWLVCVMDIKVARVMTFLTFLQCYAGVKQLTALSHFW
jgi:23S rRNA C2498 (ribose-2'-O)-methylase RlmM